VRDVIVIWGASDGAIVYIDWPIWSGAGREGHGERYRCALTEDPEK
jgi:hypothetical protein